MHKLVAAMRAAAFAALLTIAACGGGGGGSGSGGGSGATTPLPANPPVSRPEAFRFLNHAIFGATEAAASQLTGLGDDTNAYARWIDAEIAKPASLLKPAVEAACPNPVPTTFVVGALQNLPFATADFHDLLVRGAFGNYRDLLRDVTLHPAMGVYLSMLGNQKAVAGTNLRPDENYARELKNARATRVADAIYFVVTSPEYVLQR